MSVSESRGSSLKPKVSSQTNPPVHANQKSPLSRSLTLDQNVENRLEADRQIPILDSTFVAILVEDQVIIEILKPLGTVIKTVEVEDDEGRPFFMQQKLSLIAWTSKLTQMRLMGYVKNAEFT